MYFRLNRKAKGTIFYEWNYPVKLEEQELKENSSMMEVESRSNMSSENESSARNRTDRPPQQLGIENLLSTML